MFKKVLILSAVGAGHLRAAEALEKAFNQMGAGGEIKNIEVLNYTNRDVHFGNLRLLKSAGKWQISGLFDFAHSRRVFMNTNFSLPAS